MSEKSLSRPNNSVMQDTEATPLESKNPSGVHISASLNIFNELPSAEKLKELDKLSPGFSNGFLNNVLSETPHRQKLERTGQWMTFGDHMLRKILAAVVTLFLIAFGSFAIWYGSPGKAVAACFFTIALIVSVIITGKSPAHLKPDVDEDPKSKQQKTKPKRK